MKNYNRMTTMLVAAALLGLPAPAFAGDKARARDAIADADASVQAAWAAGAGDSAPAAQSRATTALDRARHQLRKSNEHHAYYAAREAEAYAQLALETAQSRR